MNFLNEASTFYSVYELFYVLGNLLCFCIDVVV